jgi:hypothetical protein
MPLNKQTNKKQTNKKQTNIQTQANNDGVTPTELVLFSTLAGIPQQSARAAMRARERIGELFFGNADSCIAMLRGSGGSLPLVYVCPCLSSHRI